MTRFIGDNGTIINHNSDFSGNVNIRNIKGEEIEVDCEDLKAFLIEIISEDVDEDTSDDIDLSEAGNWEVCYHCPFRHTGSCNLELCNPMDI